MKLRNVLSLSLAAVAALSIGTTAAFATATGEENILPSEAAEAQTHELESRMFSPTILVQITQDPKIYVNPTNATITETVADVLDADPTDETKTKDVKYSVAGKGVVSSPIFIRSDTNQALNVNATVTLASETIAIKEGTLNNNEKQASVQIQGAVASKTADEIRTIMGAAASPLTTSNFFKGSATQIKETATFQGKIGDQEPETPQFVKAVAKLAAVTPNNEGRYVPQYTGLLLTGTVSANPSTPWDANDTISARIVLSFSGV